MIEFINSFLSYLLLFVIMVVIAGVAIFIGITLRKRKNAKQEAEAIEATDEATKAN